MSSYSYPEPFNELIKHFKELPGIGGRSAERMAFATLNLTKDRRRAFGEILTHFDELVGSCPECGNLSEANKKCAICENPSRDRQIVCVVEDAVQIPPIEKSAFFKGVYHVLGGKLSPLSGVEVDDLTIDSLMKRVEEQNINEIILALPQDVEGQATMVYIMNLIKSEHVKVTQLARGLPAGSDLTYADSATMAAALNGRTLVDKR